MGLRLTGASDCRARRPWTKEVLVVEAASPSSPPGVRQAASTAPCPSLARAWGRGEVDDVLDIKGADGAAAPGSVWFPRDCGTDQLAVLDVDPSDTPASSTRWTARFCSSKPPAVETPGVRPNGGRGR